MPNLYTNGRIVSYEDKSFDDDKGKRVNFYAVGIVTDKGVFNCTSSKNFANMKDVPSTLSFILRPSKTDPQAFKIVLSDVSDLVDVG